MSRIKPQVHISVRGVTKYEHFKSYHNHLKPSLPRLFKEYDVNELFVVRSKRGQWGEWCETWEMSNGKPVIVKEGWS
jgi:hypothetical protein